MQKYPGGLEHLLGSTHWSVLLLLSAPTEVCQNLWVSSSLGSEGCSGLLHMSASLKELVPEETNCPSLGLKQVKKSSRWSFQCMEVSWMIQDRPLQCCWCSALRLAFPSSEVNATDQTQPSWEWERRLKPSCVVGECLDIFRANWSDTSHNTLEYFMIDEQSLPACVSKYLCKEGAKLEVKTAL